MDLSAEIGCDGHVVKVEAHIDVVSVLALDVDTLIFPATSKFYLYKYIIYRLFSCVGSLFETVDSLIQLAHHITGM